MSRVLVTGASGFIGMHLVAALTARGDEVACLVRKSSNVERLKPFGVRLVHGDVTNDDGLAEAIGDREVVYHLAGCTLALKNRQFYEVNRRGVVHVVKACAGCQTPPTVVFVSSLAAAGPTVDGRPRVESDMPQPVSHYGQSKRSGEHVAESFAHRVPISVVRPPIVLGEGDRISLPMFRSVIRFGVHLAPGIKPQRFSVIHAADLSHLLILAAERGRRLPPLGESGHPPGQGYYFAACEQDPYYSDLGRLIAESVGRHVLVIPAAIPVVRGVAAMGEAIGQVVHQPLFMNLDKAREIAAGSWVCSAQAAREQLGFEVGASLVERLRQTAEWYEREGWM
ncbi:MAG: NAD-dependent epimerase/dehydratase family protein [Planctomycetaceae bacterium]|nr:NAD-dependent epimerase/dehydratase family protein [Planctomycetaceae bacterium]